MSKWTRLLFLAILYAPTIYPSPVNKLGQSKSGQDLFKLNQSQVIASKSFGNRLFGTKSLDDKLQIIQTRLSTIKAKNSAKYKVLKRYCKLLKDAIQAGKDRIKTENAYQRLCASENSLEDQKNEPGFNLLKEKMEKAIQIERDALEWVKNQEYVL